MENKKKEEEICFLREKMFKQEKEFEYKTEIYCKNLEKIEEENYELKKELGFYSDTETASYETLKEENIYAELKLPQQPTNKIRQENLNKLIKKLRGQIRESEDILTKTRKNYECKLSSVRAHAAEEKRKILESINLKYKEDIQLLNTRLESIETKLINNAIIK